MDTYWCMLVKRENLISRLQVFWHIFWHLQRAGQWLNFCQQRAQFLRWWCSRLPPCHILPGGDMRVTERNPFGLGVICLRNPCRCGFLRHAYCFCWVLLIKLGLCYEFSMLGIAMEDQHPSIHKRNQVEPRQIPHLEKGQGACPHCLVMQTFQELQDCTRWGYQ